MRYAAARYQRMMRETAFRLYVTDTLYYSARGQILNQRYADLINIKTEAKDNRSGDEIAADIIKRAGLVVV